MCASGGISLTPWQLAELLYLEWTEASGARAKASMFFSVVVLCFQILRDLLGIRTRHPNDKRRFWK